MKYVLSAAEVQEILVGHVAAREKLRTPLTFNIQINATAEQTEDMLSRLVLTSVEVEFTPLEQQEEGRAE